VRAEVRHQLKQDRFSRTTIEVAEKTVHWSVEHKSKLIAAAAVVAVVAAAVAGGWYYLDQQDAKASVDFGKALQVMEEPVRPAGMPAQPESPSFASSNERATEAHKQFQAIVDKYPHTHVADFSRYFLGVTSAQLGDNALGWRIPGHKKD
jgi:TolA-binding protein